MTDSVVGDLFIVMASMDNDRNNDSNGNGDNAVSVCVVVLGDVGRSPRMQYHCASLSSHSFVKEVRLSSLSARLSLSLEILLSFFVKNIFPLSV